MARYPNKLSKFWYELKRRKVIKVMAMYAATAFIIMEAADIILPRLGLPDWTVTLIIVLLIVGFPISVILSWIFDVTPEGFMKTDLSEAGKKKDISHHSKRKIFNINNIVITILIVIVCVLLYPKIFRQDIFNDNRDADKKSIEKIAVLPFSNIRSDPETDYLGFAIADQVIGSLVYLNNISVRPSGSVRKYAKQAIDPLMAGSELEVDYILIGNFLKEANMMRLNIELIKVSNNEMIWRESIDVDFSSVFKLQDVVAQKIVDGLNIQFSQQELNRIGKDIPNNPLAYEYYLRSISYPYTNEGDQFAIEMLEQSIALDSAYAPAHAQLGDRLHRLAQYSLLNPEETKRAEASYLRALSINEESIYALANLAQIYAETARTDEAVKFTERLLEINPNNAEAHFSLGYIYRYAGLNQEAIREMENAISLDPDNQGFRSITITYLFAGDFEKAVEACYMFQESAFILGIQGRALFQLGRNSEAMECFNRVLALESGKLEALTAQGVKAYIEGKFEEGITAGLKFEDSNIADAEAWYFMAANYGLLNERDGCIRCLKRAVEGGFFNYPLMLRDPFLDSVRDEPEFQNILDLAQRKHVSFKKRFS